MIVSSGVVSVPPKLDRIRTEDGIGLVMLSLSLSGWPVPPVLDDPAVPEALPELLPEG